MDVPENMVHMTLSRTVPNLMANYLVDFSQNALDELESTISEVLAFKETDHSLLAGWTLYMCVWNAQNIGPPVVVPGPASRSRTEMVALRFPVTLFSKSFVLYYSVSVADRIWPHCRSVGINVSCMESTYLQKMPNTSCTQYIVC
jgi:hypothetical protein